MKAKDKAKELVDKFRNNSDCLEDQIQCALICVDEIIEGLEEFDDRTEKYLKEEFGVKYFSVEKQNMDLDFRFWNRVKQEITKL